MQPDPERDGGGARTGGAERIQARRSEGPGLISRLPGMAYQCRNDPRWTMEFASEGCHELTGHEAEELVGPEGVRYGDLVHEDDRDRIWAEVQRALEAGQPSFELQYRIITAGGEIRDVWERGHPVRSADGELLGLEGFVSDISELEHTRRRLSDSEQVVGSLLEQTLVGVYVIRDGVFAYINPAFARIFGYAVEEIEGRLGPLDLTTEEDRPLVRAAIRRRMEGDELSVRYEFSGRRKDGDTVRIEVHGSQVELGGERAIAGALIDMTERRALEEQLRHAQRVEGLGELTGAIAHDFNNYLTAIIAPIELALQDLGEDDPARAELLQARETAKQAASLTAQLLSFSRKRVYSPRPMGLNGLVETLKHMVERLIGERVEIEFRLDPNLPVVLADPSQLQQVLVNLVINARDAMPDGGRIVIETHRSTVEPTEVGEGSGLEAGTYAALTVRDSGEGMDEATRRRIFDPYFTTKEAGTGLGLSTVFGIVRQHGGEIRVDSAPGQGARFTVLLPSTDAIPEESNRGPARDGRVSRAGTDPSGKRLHRKATVLVVEDEETVRRVVVATLKRFGYTVLTAEDGVAAREKERNHDGRIDLLLTDMVLSDTTGPELVPHLRNRRPDLPVLLMSGYAPEDLIREVQGDQAFAFLEKPFMVSELLEAVRGVLAQEGAAGAPGADRPRAS